MTTSANPAGDAPPQSTPDPALASALRLQEADIRRQQLEAQLKLAPTEIAVLERRVGEETAAHEARRKAFQELEVRRKDLDNRLKLAEGQVLKYKTQQAEVRKNDEYQALSHQIATAEAEVDALESEEIQQLMDLDTARETLRTSEAESKRRLSDLAGEIAHVRRREIQLRDELKARTGDVETAAAAVLPVWRRAYDSAKNRVKRGPYIVPVDDHRCGGCHLRLSNEIAEGARHGGKPVHCDSCGRVVYWLV